MIRLKTYQTPKTRIEIIPMIDVMFFLLICFMLSAVWTQQTQPHLPVTLPSTHHHDVQAVQKEYILTIEKSGQLFLNQKPTQLDQLKHHLVLLMQNPGQSPLMIQADQQVPYHYVIQAMDQARAVGVRKFALATQPQTNR